MGQAMTVPWKLELQEGHSPKQYTVHSTHSDSQPEHAAVSCCFCPDLAMCHMLFNVSVRYLLGLLHLT